MNIFDLSGRVAVVSGTASGMGEAMATIFAEYGADLILLDMNTTGNEETAHALEKMGRRAIPLTVDVSKYADIDRVYETVDKEFGHVDILSNVAGNGKQGPADEMPMDDVMYVFQNLVFGRFYNTQQAGRRMLKQGRGSIMSLGSIAGVSSLGRQQAVYGMAMASVIHMTKELSTEWSGRGVRVNAILPAQTVGPKTQVGWDARMARSPGLKETFLHGIPRGRFGSPEDIKGLALWLASDASSWITGAIIPMDGGNLAMNAGGGYFAGQSQSMKV